MPTNKVRSIVIEGRIDARSLATIALALQEQGVPIRSRSHIVSMVIETYADMLIESKTGRDFESTEEALEVLSNIGIEFKSSITRSLNKLSKVIGAERATEALTENVDPTKSSQVLPDELLSQAQDILQGKDENEEL